MYLFKQIKIQSLIVFDPCVQVKDEAPAVLPSPVIPRLTLRVGAGQDKM